MKTGPSRSLLRPSNHSSGIKVPANERPHQLSATLHGFGGSPGVLGAGRPLSKGTWDQGSELSHWPRLSPYLDGVYFCEPRSPRQRGCEQNNRTLRYWLPKGTTLKNVEPTPILTVINSQPRRSLNSRTPTQVYQHRLTPALINRTNRHSPGSRHFSTRSTTSDVASGLWVHRRGL